MRGASARRPLILPCAHKYLSFSGKAVGIVPVSRLSYHTLMIREARAGPGRERREALRSQPVRSDARQCDRTWDARTSG